MSDIDTRYQEALDFLYVQTPVFQRVGASAYKPGLETSLRLSALFGNPHKKFRSIHVAGTNGKGSTAHTLAAILQSAGYRVGLYTSPHLVDFRERIRIDGRMIPKTCVVDFVDRFRSVNENLSPSFFELTMVMAFEYFASEQVDVAVVEVGLGGRLDSTNIITPELCVITNISFDHMQFLGNSLAEIAAEKAGIMKRGVPVVVSEAEGEVREVFERKARETGSEISFAQDENMMSHYEAHDGGFIYYGTPFGAVFGELGGECQPLNTVGIFTAVLRLRKLGFDIANRNVAEGFSSVTRLTGLMGRWSVLSKSPMTICDTGHNSGGWQYTVGQLRRMPGIKRMVIGFVSDKDVGPILDMMALIGQSVFYFTRADIPRALDSDELAKLAREHGLCGDSFRSVFEAYEKALADSGEGDVVFVGGSNFVVGDLLTRM